MVRKLVTYFQHFPAIKDEHSRSSCRWMTRPMRHLSLFFFYLPTIKYNCCLYEIHLSPLTCILRLSPDARLIPLPRTDPAL